MAAAIALALEPHLAVLTAVRQETAAVRQETAAVRQEIAATRTELKTEFKEGMEALGARFDNAFSTSGELVRDLRRRVEELERRR